MLTETALALCFLCILMIPLAIAGLALINTGLGRSRNAAHMMLGSLCVIAVAGIVYVILGFSLQGYRGGPAYGFLIQGKAWEWLGAMPLFFRGLSPGFNSAALMALLGLMSVAFAAIIPLGSAADRWTLSGMCISTVLFAGLTFPLFAHWAWAGWLNGLGKNFGIGVGFLDAGGAGAVHVLGGFTALSITWILGPRRGKFTPDRMPLAIPGHNSVYVLFGCLLAWLGWIGMDSAGAILYTGAEVGRVVMITINASLGAASSALAVAGLTRIRFGKPDASLCANGWIAGLVATSAGCASIRSSRRDHYRPDCGCAGDVLDRMAGAALEHRRSRRLDLRACAGRAVGIAGGGLVRAAWRCGCGRVAMDGAVGWDGDPGRVRAAADVWDQLAAEPLAADARSTGRRAVRVGSI